jgi:sulfate permease, SulP family
VRRKRRPLIAPWARGYRREWLTADAVAGVVAACVVVPQAIAYAGLAGLPVQVGLYAALVPMVVYALVGSSRALSVSVTSTVSILTASAIASSGDRPSRAALLAILVGVILLAAGLVRLGGIADLISLPILTGYKTGTGLFILSGQLGKILGIPVGGTGFFQNISDLISGLDHISAATLALGAVTIAVLVWLRRAAPQIPAPLVVVVGGVVAVVVLNLTSHGVDVVGAVKQGLPPFSLPGFAGWRALAPAAVGIALMSAVESLAAGRAMATAADPPLDANRELVALGAANLGGGLFSAYPAGGGLSQSAVQSDAGARTQLASISCAVAVALVLTLLTGVLAHLAQATLGALVIVAAVGLIDVPGLKRIARVSRRDFALALVALAGVLVFGVLDGVLLAVAASIAVLAYEVNRPPVARLGINRRGDVFERQPGEPSNLPAGVLAVRLKGRLFYLNARRVCRTITEIVDAQPQPPRLVIIDFVGAVDLEVTAIAALHDLTATMRDRGIQVWGAGVDRTQLQKLRAWGVDPAARGFPTVERAIADAQSGSAAPETPRR